ncbi:MAG: M15 family metallopeptidase [Clostridia bacterium]|nr:M15 family metallopeptidase [Clostridia bacterium]
MAKHYAGRQPKFTGGEGGFRALIPLILVIVAAIGLLVAILVLPMGRAPWAEPPMESSAPTTTTTAPSTTTTTTTTTTTASTTTTTTTAATTTTTRPAADGLSLDADGMLQFATDGRYVQASSYGAGEAVPWNLVLVNDWNPLPATYEANTKYEQVHIYYRRYDAMQVNSQMQESLNAMMAAGRAAGIKDLAVQSGYRSVSTQDRLYWAEVREHRVNYSDEIAAQKSAGTVVKRPGYSEHHTGLAVDVGGNGNFNLNQDFENTEAFKWLSTHCHEYGFILRFPKDKEEITGVIYEPWHYRYVGVEAATAIMQGGLCLEEYLQQNGI